MKREEIMMAEESEWTLLLDCPFNGDKTDYANGIVLSGTGTYITDPITGSNQVAQFTSDSNRLFLELSDFAKQDTGRCKIEVDFLCYSHSSPSYPNILDNGKSGNGGVFAQREGNYWLFGINNKGYNVSQTPTFASQELSIPRSQIPVNSWVHLCMIRIPYVEQIIVSQENQIIGQLYNDQVGIFDASVNPHMGRLAIGGSYGWSGRYLNGCLKNLKIYLHK